MLLFSAYSMDGLEADMDSLVYKPEHCILEIIAVGEDPSQTYSH